MSSTKSVFYPRLDLAFVVTLVVVMSGCAREEPEVAREPDAPTEVVELPLAPGVEDSPASVEVPVESTPEPEKLPPQSLDLSLPPDLSQGESETLLSRQQPILPNMFEGKEKKESSTRLSGKLLLDEQNPDLMRSVSGAQITVERKLD